MPAKVEIDLPENVFHLCLHNKAAEVTKMHVTYFCLGVQLHM